MILTKTPIRITFLGGGTDYPEYFNKHKGLTLGMSINKYSTIIVNKISPISNYKFEINYSKNELTNSISQINHPSVRETLNYFNVIKGLQIHYIGDVSAQTGLGSSSSFTVGLVNAINNYLGNKIDKILIAKQAIHIEQKLIKERVGCQDQITCSVGGFLKIKYERNNYDISNLKLNQNEVVEFSKNLFLVFTGQKRFAHEVLEEQIEKTNSGKIDSYLNKMKLLVKEAETSLENKKNHEDFGLILNEGWNLKKNFSSTITNDHIDMIYENGIKNGAIGGKLLGAGGGGFILFYVPNNKIKNFKKVFNEQILDFKPDFEGTKVIYRQNHEIE